MIAACTKHFHEKAMEEYNAAVGSRRFEHAAGTPLAGQDAISRTVWSTISLCGSLQCGQKSSPTSAATKSRSGAGSAFRHSVDAARAASRLAQSETAASDISQDPLAPRNARGGRASDESVQSDQTGSAASLQMAAETPPAQPLQSPPSQPLTFSDEGEFFDDEVMWDGQWYR